jgi:UDP-3-O-[3-hydroxymyristoyl] glucosamine N-acyltransferase
MRLSQLTDVVSMNILRDGEFGSLGLLSHDADNMLVGFYDPDYFDQLVGNDHVTCVITNPDLAPRLPSHLAVAVCDDPKTIFYQIHSYLFNQTDFYWTDFDSDISPEAIVHERAYVAPKNVRIGKGTIIEPNVTILERSIIGEDVVIRSGAVIGGEGFEPKYVGGKHIIVPHAGGVLLHNRVEIQANTHVARSVFGGFTELGEDTKVDALVHIAHNVRIGCRCEIAACAMIGGSAIIGDDVFIGPNASISSEIRIGNGAFVTLGAVVTRDVPDGQRVSGNFAIEHSRFISFIKSIR